MKWFCKVVPEAIIQQRPMEQYQSLTEAWPSTSLSEVPSKKIIALYLKLCAEMRVLWLTKQSNPLQFHGVVEAEKVCGRELENDTHRKME